MLERLLHKVKENPKGTDRTRREDLGRGAMM